MNPGAKVLVAVHCHQIEGGQGINVGLADVTTRNLDRKPCASSPANRPAGMVSTSPLVGWRSFLCSSSAAVGVLL